MKSILVHKMFVLFLGFPEKTKRKHKYLVYHQLYKTFIFYCLEKMRTHTDKWNLELSLQRRFITCNLRGAFKEKGAEPRGGLWYLKGLGHEIEFKCLDNKLVIGLIRTSTRFRIFKMLLRWGACHCHFPRGLGENNWRHIHEKLFKRKS